MKILAVLLPPSQHVLAFRLPAIAAAPAKSVQYRGASVAPLKNYMADVALKLHSSSACYLNTEYS
ncbi:hypothetical protein SOVF_082510 [Spinacia oleracea]|nr:hypothetical protein SOVF_082510 [Spinacia oleracea]